MNRNTVMRVAIAITVAGFVVTSAAQQVQTRGPSTQEERDRFLEITHLLEKDPLDAGLTNDREWALLWLIQAPDIHSELCSDTLDGFMKEKKYPYHGEILRQLTFAGAAFTIENPEKANDRLAQFVSAVEGALNAYNAILQQNPEARSKSLDDLLERQKQGQLQEFVREASDKGCRKR